MHVLVAGATGFVGGEVCRRLIARGEQVRALVRPSSEPAKVGWLHGLGVETVEGDLRERTTLDAACRGMDAVVSTVSSMPFSYAPGVNDIQKTDREGIQNLIDAVQAAGIDRFVYVSFSSNTDLDFPLRDAKRATEAALQASGLDYTILRPSHFMEAWLSPMVGFDAANATATIYGDGSAPISWISVGDVAEFAVQALFSPAASRTTLELGGPEALSPRAVVQLFEEAQGRSFALHFVPVEALQAQQAGAVDPMQQSFAGLMRCYAQGDAINMRETLRAIPVGLLSLAEYVRRVSQPEVP